MRVFHLTMNWPASRGGSSKRPEKVGGSRGKTAELLRITVDSLKYRMDKTGYRLSLSDAAGYLKKILTWVPFCFYRPSQ